MHLNVLLYLAGMLCEVYPRSVQTIAREGDHCRTAAKYIPFPASTSIMKQQPK